MTLLLVDDQINVINGLMNGINYRKLEIDTVLPSTSVQEAKTLICENQIDIHDRYRNAGRKRIAASALGK